MGALNASIDKNIIFINSDSERVKINSQDSVTTFRKQILKRGKFKAPPPNEDVDIDFNDDIFNELIRAFDAKALDNVPVILGTHDEEKIERIVGKTVKLTNEEDGLYSELTIADEEIVSKIEADIDDDGSGLIDEVSVGIGTNVKLDNGDEYKYVLFHVAIVTHAWYRNMNSFEKIAALFKTGSNSIIINSINSLEDIATKVRLAFYKFLDNNSNYSNYASYNYTVEGVYNDFIIVYSYNDGFLYQYSYSIGSDNEITFGNPVRVEKTFMEANMDIDKLLEALKELDIEVDSIDDLKKLIANGNKKDEVLKKLIASGNDKDEALSKINALLNPDKSDNKPDLDTLIPQVSDLSTAITTQNKRIEDLETMLVSNEAESVVKELVSAGKIIPAKKDDYVNLYKADKELFASLTSDTEKVVKTGQTGMSNGTQDNDGDELNVEDEIKRLTATIKPSK